MTTITLKDTASRCPPNPGVPDELLWHTRVKQQQGQVQGVHLFLSHLLNLLRSTNWQKFSDQNVSTHFSLPNLTETIASFVTRAQRSQTASCNYHSKSEITCQETKIGVIVDKLLPEEFYVPKHTFCWACLVQNWQNKNESNTLVFLATDHLQRSNILGEFFWTDNWKHYSCICGWQSDCTAWCLAIFSFELCSFTSCSRFEVLLGVQATRERCSCGSNWSAAPAPLLLSAGQITYFRQTNCSRPTHCLFGQN